MSVSRMSGDRAFLLPSCCSPLPFLAAPDGLAICCRQFRAADSLRRVRAGAGAEMGQFGIGQPVRRFEDKRLLTGFGRFQHDVSLAGQAHGFVLRSPHAHARIRAIDLSAAREAPGVLAIYTGEDLADAGLGTMGVPFQRKRPDGSPMFWRAHRGLAEGRVRYVGDPVAFVVAETQAQARDAAEVIDIDYEMLPSVTDTAEAAEGKIPVWDECKDNISNLFETGNREATDAAFAGATHIVRRRYVISRVYAH